MGIYAAVVALCIAVGWPNTAPAADMQTIDDAWNGELAIRHINAQLRWMPRSIGTPGHDRTIKYIEKQLSFNSDIELRRQNWVVQRDDGVTLRLINVIGRLHPAIRRRIILATHYDSIVAAYKDPDELLRKKPMPGANNSASGVAVLLETARLLSEIHDAPIGVDFLFTDGEEGPYSLGEGDEHWRALGSPHFAEELATLYGPQLPEASIVFDMVCKNNLRLYPEAASIRSGAREVNRFWEAGRSVAPEVFPITRVVGPIGDDQVALADKGIPSVLVIDFDYAPWFNTTKDTVDKCSSESLRAVGRATVRYILAKSADIAK
jgi:Zn-dependent M28 family amino/carboxypeptidase